MPLDRLPIHDQVVEDVKVSSPSGRPLRLRRVLLTQAQHAAHEGGKCWGVPGPDGKPVWAQVLLHEVEEDNGELIAVVVLMNRGVDGEEFFDSLPDVNWTRGYEGDSPVAGVSWRISGWQNPDSANQGRSVQHPLQPLLQGDVVWQRLITAAKEGDIVFRSVPAK